MAERRKHSLGHVTDRAEGRDSAEAARAWTISPRRAESLKLQARDMRRNPTEAQRVLWERLKDKQCGFTFNREVVMGSAIVDFACRTRWLVVETGGEGEAGATLAALSDRKLTDVGVRVMRFSDSAVLEDTDAVVKAIKDELQKPFERPKIEARR
jgi:very-short-patch-repair endonuclease